MSEIIFRFNGELNDFLPPDRRMRGFASRFKGRESIKDKIEALGVPHSEVDFILVNGKSVAFNYILDNGDHIGVYPWIETLDVPGITHLMHMPTGSPRFIADQNIHDIVKIMRALGLDVFQDQIFSPEELVHISINEKRIILSTSRQLLKRKRVVHGFFIRQGNREAQIQKIVNRLSLKNRCKPFSRCLICNTLLEMVEKESVWERIPPKTRNHCNDFARCLSCNRIYWKGTHYQKIKEKVDRILSSANLDDLA
ncbi:MAG: Mut7-C ubiquitin/RNAse domain-containing protein [Deltaproteobacteria bacterium]|nr:Mut7-C ubiquitin/RNAse domain-containing protein [Deltaproteobacteria bacterium]